MVKNLVKHLVGPFLLAYVMSSNVKSNFYRMSWAQVLL